MLIAGGATLLALVVVLAVVGASAGPSHQPPVTTTAAPTTVAPDTTTTVPAPGSGTSTTSGVGASLLTSTPAAFRSQCQTSKSANFFDGDATEQVTCQGDLIPKAQGLVYLRYSDPAAAAAYYDGTLLGRNGIRTNGGGDCKKGELTGTAPNGSFCEEGVVNAGASQTTGHSFVFSGSKFDVGGGADLGTLCTSSSGGFTVVGWTDEPTRLTAFALTCNSDPGTATAMENEYLHSAYDLGA